MTAWLPIVLPILAAIGSFAVGDSRHAARGALNVAIPLASSATVVWLALATFGGRTASGSLEMLPGLTLAVEADPLGLLFSAVATVLWAVTAIYAIGYMDHGRDRGRFFGFFALCIASANGVALARDPVTFFIFYEALSLATYPLVVHTGTPEALAAGRRYLFYALGGGVALLAATVWLVSIAGPVEYVPGGSLGAIAAENAVALRAIFALFVLGLGVKSALVPLHGWLPAAMVAPAPVSALLHAVAVVKAGAFGIIRLVNELYGPELAKSLGVAQPLAVLAAVTIVFGSLVALRQDDLKRRLAFSTVAQLSYIVLGTALCTPLAAAGAVAHLAHHAVMKITMFFTAGSLYETLGIKKVSAMDGVARRMPLTMASFAIAALALAGIPPLAGFYSKWMLGTGAVAATDLWATGVFVVSGALAMGYMLPILLRAVRPGGSRPPQEGESDRRLLWPIVGVATLTLIFGLTAGLPGSPVWWASNAIAPSFGISSVVGDLHLHLSSFAVDATGLPFLVIFVTIWGASAVYSAVTVTHSERSRFWSYFIPAAVGGIVVALAQDAISFYFAFALMALPSWGLVSHTRAALSQRAGRIYLTFTVVGEMLLLAGLMIASAEAGSIVLSDMRGALAASPHVHLVVALVLGSAALKIGSIGVSGILPLTYAYAPTGAAAALAGASVKVGALALLRLLPFGDPALHTWGVACITVGLSTAFVAAALGVLTTTPKAVLGYSSASQMGLILTAVGAGLAGDPVAATGAVVAYSVHHSLAKASLFFGEDVASSSSGRWRTGALWLLGIPALALAGAPFTSGFVAKYSLYGALYEVDHPIGALAKALLPWAAVGTATLMVRFLALTAGAAPIGPRPRRAQGVAALVWVGTLALVLTATWLWPASWASDAAHHATDPSSLWGAVWPLLLAAAGASAVRLLRRHSYSGPVAPGDWLLGIDSLLSRIGAPSKMAGRDRSPISVEPLLARAVTAESNLTIWIASGSVFLLLAVGFVLLGG